MSAIKAVVFDWAGTMVDFGCQAPVAALQAAFAGEGVALSAAAGRRDMGMAKRDHVRALLAHADVRDAWTKACGSPPGEEDGARVYQALEPLMAREAARFSTLIPGAAEIVAELRRRGIRIGSGTGYTREMMAPILARASEQGYTPDVVVCAGDTPSGRPSPLMLWQALISLDVWPADTCVKVDDAEVGIGEGRSGGCWTVGVAASGNGVGLGLSDLEALPLADQNQLIERAGAALLAAGAHAIVNTVADLPVALAQVERWIADGVKPHQQADPDAPWRDRPESGSKPT